jgi:hypothetical protein
MSQPPRGATSTQQRVRGTKADSGGGATSQSPKAGQVVHPRTDFMGQRAAFKTELSHLAGEGGDQTE